MFKFITNNWGAKLICLFLAIGLWAYVAIGESRVDNLPGTVPLKIKNIPAGLVPILDQDSVQVKISADRSLWNRLSSDSIDAYIDLNGLVQGTHEVDVLAKANIPNVEIVGLTPNKVLVRLEPIAKKQVPVKIQIEGQAGEGMVPGDATIEPENVELSGAQSVIDRILEATALIQLNGETSQIEKKVPLAALDSKGETIKNVTFSPQEAKVILQIVKAGSSKTVGIKVNISGKPKSGFWISQILTTPLEVTINGNAGVIRGVDYIETKPIDVEGIDSSITKNIGLNLPSGITLTNDISQIKVEIKLSTVGTDKEVDAGLIYDNLASNLKVDSIDPKVIKVVVFGSSDILNNLSSNNVQIHFDLSGYKSAGNYSVDINRDIISVPEGTSVSSVVPSAVRINLSNK